MATMLRSQDEIQARLSDLARIKQSAEGFDASDFASQLQMRSIEQQERHLRQELKAAKLLESNYDVQLIIEGQPVQEHRVDVDFFGRLLVLVQKLANRLGSASSRDRMLLTAVEPSSFQASFSLVADATDEEQQDRLIDVPVTSGVDQLCQMLDGRTSRIAITELLDSKVIKSEYARLMRLVGLSNAGILLQTRTNPLGADLSPRQAMERSKWLDELRIATKVQAVRGRLTAASLRRRTFEIETSEGTIRGKASDIAAAKIMTILLGSPVEAQVETTTKTHVEMPFPLITHFLRDISSPTAPRLEF